MKKNCTQYFDYLQNFKRIEEMIRTPYDGQASACVHYNSQETSKSNLT